MTQVNPEQSHNENCACSTCRQSRFRSKTAWASLFALVGLLLGTFGVYELIGISGTQYETIVEMLLSCMVAFGILNNPTSKDSF